MAYFDVGPIKLPAPCKTDDSIYWTRALDIKNIFPFQDGIGSSPSPSPSPGFFNNYQKSIIDSDLKRDFLRIQNLIGNWGSRVAWILGYLTINYLKLIKISFFFPKEQNVRHNMIVLSGIWLYFVNWPGYF